MISVIPVVNFSISNERFLRPERLPYPVWRRRLPGCAQGTLRAYHSIHAADFIFPFTMRKNNIFLQQKKQAGDFAGLSFIIQPTVAICACQ